MISLKTIQIGDFFYCRFFLLTFTRFKHTENNFIFSALPHRHEMYFWIWSCLMRKGRISSGKFFRPLDCNED